MNPWPDPSTSAILAGEAMVTLVASTRAFTDAMFAATKAWIRLGRLWRRRPRIHANARRRRKRARRGR